MAVYVRGNDREESLRREIFVSGNFASTTIINRKFTAPCSEEGEKTNAARQRVLLCRYPLAGSRLCFIVWWILLPSVFKCHREKKRRRRKRKSIARFSLARLFFSELSQFRAITIEINYALGGVIPASLTRTHRALSQFLYIFPYMIRRRTGSSHGDVN